MTAYDFSVCLEFILFLFFFQAEDGIRDHCVTGVHTCALPILIASDTKPCLRQKMAGSLARNVFAPEAFAEYERCFTSGTIHASCEDYRAAATIDLVHYRADRDAGRRVKCPLLALWGERGIIGRCFEPLDEWRRVADDVRGHGVPSAHYIPEEVPDILAAELETFFAEGEKEK